MLKVFEGIREFVHDSVGTEDIPSAEFIFGGYSWIRKRFMIWKIHFQAGMGSFQADSAKTWRGIPWIFAGDVEHVKEARIRLSELLNSRGNGPHQVERFKLDWEPFEVIRDMLRQAEKDRERYRNDTIGGAPQILKIYEHLNSRFIGVQWEIGKQRNSQGVYIAGRKTLTYESPSVWVLNPDTLLTRSALYSDACVDLPIDEAEEEPYDLSNQGDRAPAGQ